MATARRASVGVVVWMGALVLLGAGALTAWLLVADGVAAVLAPAVAAVAVPVSLLLVARFGAGRMSEASRAVLWMALTVIGVSVVVTLGVIAASLNSGLYEQDAGDVLLSALPFALVVLGSARRGFRGAQRVEWIRGLQRGRDGSPQSAPPEHRRG